MKRKIIKLGTATLVASLPSKWIKEFNLKQGDYLDVEEKKGELVLSAEKAVTEDEKKLDFTNINSLLAIIFLEATYNSGFSKIVITHGPTIEEYRTKKIMETTEFLQRILREQYIGMEIIEQSKTHTVLKEVGEVSDKEADNILSRALWLTKWMADECLEALKKNDQNTLKAMKGRWENVIRFLNYYRRTINKKGYKDFEKTPIVLEITSHIKTIADAFRYIAKDTYKLKRKYTKESLDVFEKVNSSLDKFCKVFFKFDEKILMEIVSEREKIWDEINKQRKSLTKDDIYLYNRLSMATIVLLKAVEDRFALEI